MRILKNSVIIRWITIGVLLACFLGACGFFALPVIMQLIENHKAALDIHIPEPPPPLAPPSDP